MGHAIDINNLSLDELYVLAGRVECRIRTLSASTKEQTATSAPAGGVGSEPFRSDMVSGIQSETRATLSEKVQDLINTNDLWEGSGVEPTRWSLLFYGGHIVRTHESAACLPRAQRHYCRSLVGRHAQILVVRLQNLPYSCANYRGVCPALPIPPAVWVVPPMDYIACERHRRG